jgi:hypothetical protein
MRRVQVVVLFLIIIMIGISSIYLVFKSSNIDKYGRYIEWTSISEFSIIGYNVYRSKGINGPFKKLNPNIIAAGSDRFVATDYLYFDKAADPALMYYYLIEEIDLSGEPGWGNPLVSYPLFSTQINMFIFPFVFLSSLIVGIIAVVYKVRTFSSVDKTHASTPGLGKDK